MSDGDVIRPFRWDVAKRSQLGSLPEVDLPETYQEFEDDLFACCARLLAFAGDSDIVFVGRSPHAIFDLLSGLLLDTTWTDRLQLLNVALRRTDPTREEVLALHPYLDAVGLAPRRLERRSRPIALADVVAEGWTFRLLTRILSDWAPRPVG